MPKLRLGDFGKSPENRTPEIQHFSFGVGHALSEVIRQLVNSFRLVFFLKVLGLSAANAGWMKLFCYCCLIVLSPFGEFLVDRVKIPILSVKLGRRKSWHLIGTIIGAITTPLFYSSCSFCHGSQWFALTYTAILYTFMALALALINISHLSLVPAIAKNQKEISVLSALRTGFTFVIGVIIYLVTWVILGQDNKDRLSPENSMDFTVTTVILVGVALVFGLIFHIITVEPPGDSEPRRKLSASVAECRRKNSFVPSDDVPPSMTHEVVDKGRDQKRKERMCDLFVDSLETKGEIITTKVANNVERKRSMDMFPMRFPTALFSDEKGKHKTQKPPFDDIALTEKQSPKCKGHGLFIKPEEEVCENLSKLPQERKMSLVLSISDKLTGEVNENNKRLPNLPKEIEHIAVNIDSDSQKNCEEIFCSSNSSEDGSTSYEAHEQQLSYQNSRNKKKTSAPSISATFATENEGFDCNETGLTLNESPASSTSRKTGGTDSGKMTSTIVETDVDESDGQVVEQMSVRTWLKNPHLYKVAIIFACAKVAQNISYSYLPLFLTDTLKFEKEAIAYLPLVILLSSIVSSGISKKLEGEIGRKGSSIFAALLVIGASFWFYIITPSIRVQIYPAAALLGVGFSAMFVNSLCFTTELIGDNQIQGYFLSLITTDTRGQRTSGFVFAFVADMSYLMQGATFAIVQKLFPEGSSSEDCQECSDYVRQVFSILPGSFALLSLLTVLFFQSSRTKREGNAMEETATSKGDETT